MSAGVSILVPRKLGRPKHVVRVFDAPQKLQERASAVRLRNWKDNVIAIVSIGPMPKEKSSRASYAETLFCLAGWRMVLHVAFSQSLTAEKGLLLKLVDVQHRQGWAAALWVHFFSGDCLSTFFFSGDFVLVLRYVKHGG